MHKPGKFRLPLPLLFDPARERELLDALREPGPLRDELLRLLTKVTKPRTNKPHPGGRPRVHDWNRIRVKAALCFASDPEKKHEAVAAEIRAWCKATKQPRPNDTELMPIISAAQTEAKAHAEGKPTTGN
jgi:hypothetical protein